MIKIFLDCDILLDYLCQRIPFYESSLSLFEMIEESEHIISMTSPLVISNVHYVYSAHLKGRENKKAQSLRTINELLLYTEIVDLPGEPTKGLLAAPGIRDFEDALQLAAAQRAGADYLITRNVKDYPLSHSPKILHPIDDKAAIWALRTLP